MVALLWALPGCNSLTFACSDDMQCGAEGTCEAKGWCSFPDIECASGRRYADASGEGLGGACVEDPGGSSSSGPGGGPTPLGSTSDVDDPSTSGSSSSTTSTVTTDPITTAGSTGTTTSTATSVAESSTGGPGSTDASTGGSTGGSVQPCVGISDDFDDGMVDPDWASFGNSNPVHGFDEAKSALQWEFSTGVVEIVGVQHVLDMPFGRTRIHVTDVPAAPMSAAQLVLGVHEHSGDQRYFFLWFNGMFEVRDGSETLDSIPAVEWVEIADSPQGLVVSVSDSGDLFAHHMTLSPGIDVDDAWVVLYGQTWTPASETATAAVDFLEICEP